MFASSKPALPAKVRRFKWFHSAT